MIMQGNIKGDSFVNFYIITDKQPNSTLRLIDKVRLISEIESIHFDQFALIQ